MQLKATLLKGELFVDFSPVKIASASYTNTMHTALLFQSICSLINESTLLLIIFLGAFILNPKVFILILLALFTLFILIFRPISKHVAKLGRETQKVDYSRHRFIFTMSNAIKDIKIMGLENPFIKRSTR